ncbi:MULTISPECIES: Gfo/Idh/MocA family protein [unclassified Agarivorans]|uniref:Gfo/Idh/MocA family protein n=1 Tax=unclassified Agarivorans TaxID=2636026 RepID=UPI0026E1644F|nr:MULTISPECIES: Gfo/Idh/MocA family oxidoreductase [unclassified Agarivorans]MDO6687936.1 Gfo/Idh/MocA family oxidoreductase [Agarivorans sp. 3_MG-2023]MDO6717558.1 Gfo/Idh/MocA family oxidoreductase [Agarivorans sp. 2_MG-2023]
MDRIKLGMVGGGNGAFIGAIHRIAARLDNHYELVAGALSANPERAAQSALDFGIASERSYSDYTVMASAEAARKDGIEAVSIVTPNHLHFPIAKAFLAAGIHVICDKPMTCSLHEALELKNLANNSGKLFVLTHNYSAYPMVRQAQHMVSEGILGKLRLVQVEYAQDWLTTAAENTGNKQAEWRTDPKRSGPAGCLGDIGTHAFNLAAFISGLQLEQVSAELSTFVEGRVLDDNVQAMLRFEQGVRGMLWSSQVAPGNENGLRIRIYGSDGGLEWSQEHPNQLLYSPFAQPSRILSRAGYGYQSEAEHLARTPAGHPEGYLEGFANLYTETAQAIRAARNGDSPTEILNNSLLPGVKQGVEGLQFINAMIHSSQNDGKWTPLENVHELA